MENDNENKNPPVKTSPAPRMVNASQYRDGTLIAKFQIHASTKHGNTLMVGVTPPVAFEVGDALVTESWMFSARNFVVLARHDRPMKIAGDWYQVRTAKAPPKGR